MQGRTQPGGHNSGAPASSSESISGCTPVLSLLRRLPLAELQWGSDRAESLTVSRSPDFVAKTTDFIFHSCQSWKASLVFFVFVFTEEVKTGLRVCNQVLLIGTDGAGLLLQNIYSSYTLSNSASCFEINKLLLQNCTVKAEVCPLPAQAVVTGLGELMH